VSVTGLCLSGVAHKSEDGPPLHFVKVFLKRVRNRTLPVRRSSQEYRRATSPCKTISKMAPYTHGTRDRCRTLRAAAYPELVEGEDGPPLHFVKAFLKRVRNRTLPVRRSSQE
jgi:hypothetical protein